MNVFWRAVGDFLRAWPRLLAADMAYKIIAFVILTPLVSLTLKLFMASKRSSVLADQDILFFVLSPVGLAALVVVGAVSLAILVLEQACLMAIAFGETRDLHVRTTDALWYGACRSWPVVMLALRIFIRVLLIALPFLAVGGLVYLLLLGEHDINFYLAERPPIFVFAAVAVAVLLTVMAVLIIRRLLSWAFALPLLLFEDAGPPSSLTTSVGRHGRPLDGTQVRRFDGDAGDRHGWVRAVVGAPEPGGDPGQRCDVRAAHRPPVRQFRQLTRRAALDQGDHREVGDQQTSKNLDQVGARRSDPGCSPRGSRRHHPHEQRAA
jgi:hypothetical protein